MSFRTTICVGLATMCLATSLASSANSADRRWQRFNRRIGVWSSSGYHWRNPGPNPEYYSPFSAHNSRLISNGYSGGMAPSLIPGAHSTIPQRIFAGSGQQVFPHLPGDADPAAKQAPAESESSTPQENNAVDPSPSDGNPDDNDKNVILNSGQIQSNNDWPAWDDFMPAPKRPKLVNPSSHNP